MKHCLAVALVLTAALASAQRSPTGATSRTMLAMMPDVKKELKVTKDQDKKIQAAMKAMEDQAMSGAMQIDMTDPMAGMDVDMGPILDEAQRQRLDELFVQYNGGFALTDPKVATSLAISEEVIAQIKSLKATASQELLQMMMNARSTAAIKAADKKREDYSQQMLALLTDEQKQKFDAMKGKPFKFKM
jgi:hypothetical protein